MALRLRHGGIAFGLWVAACATATNGDDPGTGIEPGAGASGEAGSGAAGAAHGGASSMGGAPTSASGAGGAVSGAGVGGTNAGSGGTAGKSGAGAGGAAGAAGKAGVGGAAAGGAAAGGAAAGGAAAGGAAAGGAAAGGAAAGGAAAGGAGGAGNGCANPGTVTLSSIYDAELNAQMPAFNAAYVAEVHIVRGGANGSHRAVFWFDLGQAPAGKTLKSATLQLTIANNPGLSKNLAVHRISQTSNRKWEEPQVTWNEYKNASSWTTPGGDFLATATATQAIGDATASGTVLAFNVLADAQSFYATPATNYGWLIKDPLDSTNPSGENVYIATRENTTITPPKLVLTYCP